MPIMPKATNTISTIDTEDTEIKNNTDFTSSKSVPKSKQQTNVKSKDSWAGTQQDIEALFKESGAEALVDRLESEKASLPKIKKKLLKFYFEMKNFGGLKSGGYSKEVRKLIFDKINRQLGTTIKKPDLLEMILLFIENLFKNEKKVEEIKNQPETSEQKQQPKNWIEERLNELRNEEQPKQEIAETKEAPKKTQEEKNEKEEILKQLELEKNKKEERLKQLELEKKNKEEELEKLRKEGNKAKTQPVPPEAKEQKVEEEETSLEENEEEDATEMKVTWFEEEDKKEKQPLEENEEEEEDSTEMKVSWFEEEDTSSEENEEEDMSDEIFDKILNQTTEVQVRVEEENATLTNLIQNPNPKKIHDFLYELSIRKNYANQIVYDKYSGNKFTVKRYEQEVEYKLSTMRDILNGTFHGGKNVSGEKNKTVLNTIDEIIADYEKSQEKINQLDKLLQQKELEDTNKRLAEEISQTTALINQFDPKKTASLLTEIENKKDNEGGFIYDNIDSGFNLMRYQREIRFQIDLIDKKIASSESKESLEKLQQVKQQYQTLLSNLKKLFDLSVKENLKAEETPKTEEISENENENGNEEVPTPAMLVKEKEKLKKISPKKISQQTVPLKTNINPETQCKNFLTRLEKELDKWNQFYNEITPNKTKLPGIQFTGWFQDNFKKFTGKFNAGELREHFELREDELGVWKNTPEITNSLKTKCSEMEKEIKNILDKHMPKIEDELDSIEKHKKEKIEETGGKFQPEKYNPKSKSKLQPSDSKSIIIQPKTSIAPKPEAKTEKNY